VEEEEEKKKKRGADSDVGERFSQAIRYDPPLNDGAFSK
jgi:hypothetical protein